MTGRTPTLTQLHAAFPHKREVSGVWKTAATFFCALAFPLTARAACPDLQTYYPASAETWPQALQQIAPLMPECLQSPEYFALLGAAQMNSGRVTEALESLERALLLDPDNGAAGVDYAQALYIAGQIFPALEINESLLQRNDLPPEVATLLQERQQVWQAETHDVGFAAEVAAGYDNNLNGAPASSDFTLTLSGEAIQLTLDPEYQPISGGYLNMRLSGFYRALTPERSHDLVFALRNRRSEHSGSEILQFDWRYAQSLSLRRYRWDFVAGTSHLFYGGSPLYSVTEARVRLNRIGAGCRPQYEAAMQHQLYHGQGFMNGLEASATAGFYCQRDNGKQFVGIDAGPLINRALKDTRPGEDRDGWRVRVVWQLPLGAGTLSNQFSYANLNDAEGYSDLLADGAKRQIDSRQFRAQYSRLLQSDLTLIINVSHQRQGSNLAPFANDGTALDIGLSLNF